MHSKKGIKSIAPLQYIIVSALNKCVYCNIAMHKNRQGLPPEGGSGSAQKETN